MKVMGVERVTVLTPADSTQSARRRPFRGWQPTRCRSSALNLQYPILGTCHRDGDRQIWVAAVLAVDEREASMTYHIKPGPKPKREDGGDDRRRHVDPPNAPKHPTLPIHNPPKKK